MIFLAEYASILFIRIITVMLFLGGDLYSFLFFVKLVFVSFL
jgi:NADH-ubiquinone oxidoreductase chain 1